MKSRRRKFLGGALAAVGGVLFRQPTGAWASAEEFGGWPDRFGMLTDLSLCIGCRKCEEACQKANDLPPGKTPPEDMTVFEHTRRTDAENYTVVNRFERPEAEGPPVYVKKQCMHCDEPACAAACLVGAFKKTPEGPVAYDASVCLGCRYCMVACPFYIPAYEYSNATSPRVRKCTLCSSRIQGGQRPACAEACPREAITFGRRNDLIDLARETIRSHPKKYRSHIYGVNEVGGTSWLYISEVPFEQLGFPVGLGEKPFAEYTRGFLSMVPAVFVIWPALLGGFYAFTQARQAEAKAEKSKPASSERGK